MASSNRAQASADRSDRPSVHQRSAVLRPATRVRGGLSLPTVGGAAQAFGIDLEICPRCGGRDDTANPSSPRSWVVRRALNRDCTDPGRGNFGGRRALQRGGLFAFPGALVRLQSQRLPTPSALTTRRRSPRSAEVRSRAGWRPAGPQLFHLRARASPARRPRSTPPHNAGAKARRPACRSTGKSAKPASDPRPSAVGAKAGDCIAFAADAGASLPDNSKWRGRWLRGRPTMASRKRWPCGRNRRTARARRHGEIGSANPSSAGRAFSRWQVSGVSTELARHQRARALAAIDDIRGRSR